MYDSRAIHRFVGVDLGHEPAPCEAMVCKFRYLLEAHNLPNQVFELLIKAQRKHHCQHESIRVLLNKNLISSVGGTINKQHKQIKTKETPWPAPPYAWYVVGVLSLAYTISFIDRMILNLLVVPIQQDLHISDTEISLIIGFGFGLFYALLGLPIGRLVDCRSRRTIIAVGITLWSLMTAVTSFARNFWHLLFARMGVGVGEATLSPSAYSLISDYFPPNKLARAMSVYVMGINIGGGLALIVGGAVVGLISNSPDIVLPLIGQIRPWQAAFLVVGLPGLPVAVLMYTIKEPMRRNQRKLELVSQPGKSVPVKDVMAFLATNRKVYGVIFTTFSLTAILTYGTSTWLPTFFIRIHNWSITEVGLYFGLVVLFAGTGGNLAGGWFADWLLVRGYRDAKLLASMIGLLAVIPLGVIAPLMPSAELALAMLVPTWFFINIPMSLGPSVIQEITPNQMRGQISALFLLVASLLGMGVGPFAVALLTDFIFANPAALNFSLSIMVGVTASLAVLVLWFGIQPFIKDFEEVNNPK